MSAYTGIFIPADPTVTPTIQAPESFEGMKKLMGIDWAQVHHTDDQTFTFWADEEGLMVEQPMLNYRATALIYEREGITHPVVGPVFVTGGVDEDGNSLPLGDELAREMLSSLTVASVDQLLERVRLVNSLINKARQ